MSLFFLCHSICTTKSISIADCHLTESPTDDVGDGEGAILGASAASMSLCGGCLCVKTTVGKGEAAGKCEEGAGGLAKSE